MTVYDVWAEFIDGERKPVLCLHQRVTEEQDLLLLFEGAAASRA